MIRFHGGTIHPLQASEGNFGMPRVFVLISAAMGKHCMWTERKLREFRLFGHAVSSPIYIYIPAIYINVMSLDNFRGLVEGERERGERELHL